jgi:hypothetical protein
MLYFTPVFKDRIFKGILLMLRTLLGLFTSLTMFVIYRHYCCNFTIAIKVRTNRSVSCTYVVISVIDKHSSLVLKILSYTKNVLQNLPRTEQMKSHC